MSLFAYRKRSGKKKNKKQRFSQRPTNQCYWGRGVHDVGTAAFRTAQCVFFWTLKSLGFLASTTGPPSFCSCLVFQPPCSALRAHPTFNSNLRDLLGGPGFSPPPPSLCPLPPPGKLFFPSRTLGGNHSLSLSLGITFRQILLPSYLIP